MTENKAKEWIEYLGNKNLPYDRSPISRKSACDMAIQALEEVQAYRAVGTIEEFKSLKEINVTQSDIDTFKVYIEDCMDAVAFGNTDWNHSLALALKCMELHKA